MKRVGLDLCIRLEMQFPRTGMAPKVIVGKFGPRKRWGKRRRKVLKRTGETKSKKQKGTPGWSLGGKSVDGGKIDLLHGRGKRKKNHGGKREQRQTLILGCRHASRERTTRQGSEKRVGW